MLPLITHEITQEVPVNIDALILSLMPYALAALDSLIQTMHKIWRLTYVQQAFELCMAPQ